MNEYQRHPISAAFGDITGDEFQDLKDRVETLGVLEPIVLYEEQVLDGWQRYRAARELGIEPRFDTFEGSYEQAVEFALAKHTRRNMTVAARIQVRLALQAADPKPGRPRKQIPGTSITTLQSIGSDVGVSASTVKRVVRVTRNAIPEVKELMARGTLQIKRAAEIAALSPDEQHVAVAQMSTDGKSGPRRSRKRAPRFLPPQGGPLEMSVDEYALHEMREGLKALCEENDRLVDRVASLAIGAEATEEERMLFAETLASLRDDLRVVRAELDATRASRNSYMTECNELKKEVATLRRRIDRHTREQSANSVQTP